MSGMEEDGGEVWVRRLVELSRDVALEASNDSARCAPVSSGFAGGVASQSRGEERDERDEMNHPLPHTGLPGS
jgi:hypothetical protein